MKLLCVTTCFPSEEKPYYGIFLYQQLKELSNLGVSVNVLVPDNSSTDLLKKNYNGIDVYYFGYEGTKWYKNPTKKNVKFQCNLKRLLLTNKYDIVQFDIIPFNMLNIFNELKPINTVYSYHVHGLNIWGDFFVSKIKNFAQSVFKKRALKRIDCYIGVSKLTSKTIEKKVDRAKIFTVYNGVDTALFYPVIKKEKEVFAIGIIANLIKIKGHEYLIKGLKRYIEKSGNKKVILKIIGDGPEKGNILRLVNSLNLTNNVSMIDCLSYEDIAKFLREQCDMFIMPSFFEAFGCVYLEAMACKIPTVGVFECGIAEIIENNVNGFLVHKNNVDEITKCIENVIDNRQSLIIAENGYITVKEQFTWKQSANNLYNIYCSLLKNGGIKKR